MTEMVKNWQLLCQKLAVVVALNVRPIVTYSSETLTLTAKDENKHF
jgi:hypothetical protein